jgi:hypothetical protein
MDGQRSKCVLQAVLVVSFLVVQAVSVAHIDIEEAHPADETCALCVALAVLGTASITTPASFHVVIQCAERDAFVPKFAVRSRIECDRARGPPAAS